MKLIIEKRYLFDASVGAIAKHVVDHAHDHTVDVFHHAPPSAQPTQILFIDSRVADWQELAAGAKKGVEVVIVNPDEDGLAQVTAALQGKNGITSISFITYGQPGQMELGSSIVNDASITSNAAQIASWGSHLAANADILLYGCNVGEGAAGQAFIQDLHGLTGAQVAASTDATGAAALGGNWVLEASTGTIDAHAPVTHAALESYQGVLDAPLPTVSVLTSTAQALLGSTFSETLAFSNTAATGVGYGPFIDVFVPTDAAQSATLTSATYLGSSVTITTVALSTSVAGHVGVLGALHPLAVDSTGAAIFVQAPAGYVAGDTMYVLTLPFGSYTPGEPAANIVLNFSMANTTELSSAHAGQPLNITAIAGFEYGADPLNDPSTDPSIRGTGASVSLSDPADGAVTAGSQVTLIDVSATTNLHEDETATGPDYPFDYVVTLSPALVTQADPFTSFDFTFNLPNTVQYTGGAITLGGPSAAAGTPSFTPNSGVGPFNNDGAVTVHFTSLTTNAADAPTTITIPVFVPQNDANGVAVLSPTTGAPRTITETGPLPIYSYTGNWDAVVGSLDHTGIPQPFSGDSTTNPLSTDFVAKSLAIQISDNASSVVPGQNITYTVNFEVSDFFDLNNLAIQTALTDGVTLLAPGDLGYAAPTLSVTRSGVTTGGISFTDVTTKASFTFTTPPAGLSNEVVAESGSNSFWNYTRDDAGTGATTINFSVGALLFSQFGMDAVASVLQGGGGGPTQGTITFLGRALAWYTNTFSDRALREGDTVGETVNTAGTNADVVTVVGPSVTPTGSSVTDGSSASDTVPQGSLALTIVAINGAAPTGSPTIAPGDTVTYALTYTLAVGDYGNLNLDGFLPLPVFNAADPLANGGSVATYAVDNADQFPIAGDYKLVQAPTGGAVGAVTVDGTANSVNFNLGTLNNPAAGPATVQIYFTSTASNKPFVDGLFLALQGTDLYTNAASVTSNAAAITNLTLNEPEVVTKTGIVGVVGDDGATLKGTFTEDPTNNVNGVTWPTPQSTTPGTIFSAADSTGNPFTGSGMASNADNLDVTGADAGDTVRVVSTVFNQGHATAFDVTTSGALPAGYTMANVSHFQVVDGSGNPVAFTGTEANYFSGAGIQVTPGLAANSAYFVVYDLTLTAAQATGQTGVLALTASSAIVNWADYVGGVAAGDGFVSGGAAVGESANALTDNATIGTNLPSIAKTAVAADDTTAAGSPAPVNLNNVVLGETVQYQLVITLPEGSTLNGAADLKAQDILPAGMSFVSLDSIVYGSGVTHTGGGTAGTAGQTVTFDLGANVTNSNPDVNGTITILYTAQVNSTNTPTDGHSYTNNASLIYNGTAIPATNLTLTERDPLVAETLSVVDTVSGLPPSGGIVYSNENLTYTITLKNNGDEPANGVTDFVTLPAGLTYVASSLAVGTGGTGPSVNDSLVTTTGLEVQLNSLAPGATATFTFQATVNPSQPFGSVNTVQTPNDGTSGVYNSLPASVGVGHNYTDTASVTVTTGQLTGVLSIVGESNNTNVPPPTQNNTTTATDAVVGEIVRMHAYVQVPEGSDPTSLDFALPSGFQYLNDGSASVAFVSADAAMTSSQPSLAGLTAYQDTNSAGLNYVNPATGTTTAGDVATFAPVQALPGAVITTPGGHFDVNLGTLTDNAGSTTPNFVLIEFDALVTNVAANVNLTTLTTNFSANGGPNSNNTVVTVEEPHIAITKNVTAINQGTDTVTYAVKLTNTGDAAAYNVTLDNPVVTNEQNITFVSATGPGANTDTTTATDLHDVITSLAVGQSETITYTVQVISAATPVTNDIATATWASLPGSFSFHGSSGGADDSATGFRDFNAGSNPPDSYRSQVTADLGTASGQVWQDLGSTPTLYTPTTDTALNGLTVTVDLPGPDGVFGTGDDIFLTTTTAGAGNYSFGLLPDGFVRVSLNTDGTAGGPGSTESLIFDPDQNGRPSNPAGARITIAAGSAISNVNFAFQIPDTPPAISSWSDGTPGVYVQGTAPIVLSDTGTAAVADTQLDTLIGVDPGITDYRNTVLTVERYTGVGGTAAANANDVFGGDGAGAVNLVLSGGNVTFNGTLLGTFTQAAGVLTITFGAGVQKADIGNVLDHLTYKDTGAALGGTVVMGSTLYDGNEFGAKDYQGSEPDVPKTLDNTSAAAFVSINLSPTYNPVSTFTEPNDSSAAAVAVNIAPALIADSATYTGATATISTNFQAGGDVLTASTVGTSIVASYNAATGVMTLTGTDTAAHYQQVLRTLQFYDTDNPLSTLARTVTIVAAKATGNDTLGTATVNVVADNQSPILAAGTPNTSGTEDTAPTGPVGTLVSSLIGGLVTDPDGPQSGIALTAAQTTFTQGAATITGNWFFTTNGGTTWSPVSLSAGQGLDLIANANTRLYFQPTTANYNGMLPNALTFQAWDGKNGVVNGTVVTMPGSPGTGLSSTGAPQTDSSSYSTASDNANLIVAAVNDAPIATGTTNLGQIFAGDPNPPGATVATLFGPNFSDTADQQQTGANPTGSLANNLAGIAITANAATALQGSWEYSTNGGATWNVMPAVSTASSVELPTTAELRFVPAAGFQGAPGALSVHLIDDSSGAVVAATGVNVTVNGGITPISSGVVPLTITVLPAPVLSIVGESNNTTLPPNTPTQTDTQVAADAVVGEIVRMHAYVEVPPGTDATTLNFTLPSGLQYLNDGTATIAFVSPDGLLTSSNPALSALTPFQDTNPVGLNYVNPATGTTTANDAATLAPSQFVPASIVTTPGNDAVINLGMLTDNAAPTQPNYVIVEFNALVTNVAANHNGVPLSTTFAVNSDANSNATVVTIEEPGISVTKNVTAIDSATGTVTYAVTLTNTGDATAYNVTLDNPVVANEQNTTFVSATGPGANTDTTTATDLHDVVSSLAVGTSETITYTVKVTTPSTPVVNDMATATFSSLPGSFTFAGSSGGASDGAAGFRDFNGASNPPNDYTANANADLGTADGRVWQDLGSTPTVYTPTTDTALPGLTVTATLPGPDGIFGTGDDVVLTTTTGVGGTYSFGLLPDGPVRISLNTNGNPGGPGATENLIFDPDQGGQPSNPAGAQITIAGGVPVTGADFAFQLPDTPPAISNWSDGAPGTYIQGTSPIVLSDTGAAGVADTQLDTLIAAADPGVTDYRNTVLTVERYTALGGTAAPNANDVFGGDGAGAVNLVLSGGNVTFNGTLLGTFSQAAGVLTITFGAGVQKADIGNVLDHLTYQNTGAAFPGSVVIGSTLYDGNEAGGLNYQGSEPDVPKTLDNTSAPAFVSVTLLPASALNPTFTEPNDSSPAAVAVDVFPTLIANTGGYLSATVSITANFVPGGEDVLTANTTGTSITATYDNTTGVLTLSGADTTAHYQQVIRTVQYYDNSDTPSTALRTVAVIGQQTTGPDPLGTSTVTVVADNDSPILAAGVPDATGVEDTAPSGAVGTLVSSLLTGLVTDPDGPGLGMAITAAKTSFTLGSQTITGTWFYTIDGGTTWTPIALAAGQGLDLVADANTRVYFQPTTANYNGTLPGALTFQAWDATNGVANGTVVTMPASPGMGLSSTGAPAADSSSYSSAFDIADVIVSAINDAPVAAGTASLGTVTSGDNNPHGETVAQLFAPTFSDTADQQGSASNPGGSAANTLAGIAITGDAAIATQGVWQYSTDGGTTWIAVPTTVATNNALVLAPTAELRFVAPSSFEGTPGALTVHVIDNSSGPVANATGVDVTVNGGITPISSSTVPLDVSVQPPPPVLLSPPATGAGRTPPEVIGGSPLIPEIWLTGSGETHFIITDQHSIIQVPPDIFQDTDPSQQLTYEAELAGGAPLPSWLNFDARSLVFTGTPPENAYGTYDIVITARDTVDNRAVAEFRIIVGREQGDLQSLMRTLWITDSRVPGERHGHPHKAAHHVTHHHAAHHARAHGAHHKAVTHKHAVTGALDQKPDGHAGLSSQLLNTGRTGSLASAHALLKALTPFNTEEG